ncbi:MAG TPA: hypothetical protein VGT44_22760, partial [Ktedonobacteraceae bacterium]|nr:hypothetical protein [Ktedonobacteraceae bacterium]
GHLRAHSVSYDRRDEFFGEFDHSAILDLLADQNETAALAATTGLLRSYAIDVAPETLASELQESGAGR